MTMVIAAKDIPAHKILDMLSEDSWITAFAIEEALSEYPPKVVTAKLRSLKRRGLAFGCEICGCSGWHLTEKTDGKGK